MKTVAGTEQREEGFIGSVVSEEGRRGIGNPNCMVPRKSSFRADREEAPLAAMAGMQGRCLHGTPREDGERCDTDQDGFLASHSW